MELVPEILNSSRPIQFDAYMFKNLKMINDKESKERLLVYLESETTSWDAKIVITNWGKLPMLSILSLSLFLDYHRGSCVFISNLTILWVLSTKDP